MQTIPTGSSADTGVLADDPFLEIEGVEGTVLRATPNGVLLADASRSTGGPSRFWAYGDLGGVRLDAYGPIGVIRATLRSTRADLPLLLLEPNQITAARRGLEIVWNLMGSRLNSGEPA
jgi:hypothetical protein